jgi:hypothetical protein
MRPGPAAPSKGACQDTWSPGMSIFPELKTYLASCCMTLAGQVGGVASPRSRTSRKVSSKPKPLGRPGPLRGCRRPSPWRSESPRLLAPDMLASMLKGQFVWGRRGGMSKSLGSSNCFLGSGYYLGNLLGGKARIFLDDLLFYVLPTDKLMFASAL